MLPPRMRTSWIRQQTESLLLSSLSKSRCAAEHRSSGGAEFPRKRRRRSSDGADFPRKRSRRRATSRSVFSHPPCATRICALCAHRAMVSWCIWCIVLEFHPVYCELGQNVPKDMEFSCFFLAFKFVTKCNKNSQDSCQNAPQHLCAMRAQRTNALVHV